MIATLWDGPLPTADVLEKLWLAGKLPPGLLPPLYILERYSGVIEDEPEVTPDDTQRIYDM